MSVMRLLPFALALSFAACATTGVPPPTVEAPKIIQMEEVRIQPAPDPLTGLDTYDASDLLSKGNQLLDANEQDKAVEVYERLIEAFPTSDLVPVAIYNQGLAYEGLAEFEQALSKFERVIRQFPETSTAKDAHYRSCIALSKLDRWQEVADRFWKVRQAGGLTTMDELEARAGMGVAMFMMKDYDTAEKEFMGAVRFYEERSKQEVLSATYWVAQSRFYLGEIYARRFEELKLLPKHPGGEAWKTEMTTLLEEKCDLLLRAQNNFIRAIRVGHAGWATASGFRIGSMYEALYDQMLGVETPADLPKDARPYYDELLKEKIGVLVNKAIQVYERSLEMAERVGEKNEWVERTAKALERMKTLALEAIKG
ncbi:MAG: tetratricopeptide repeat protein [Myxococcota bacterium]